MNQDRRVRKSKNAMKKALFELMNKIPYSKITICKLCELADINRSTFYSNYETLDELLKDIHFDFFTAMLNHTDKNDSSNDLRKQILIGMVNYVQLHQNEVKILFFNNENNLLEINMLNFILNKYGKLFNNNYALIYHTIGFFTLLNQWVKDDFPCSSEQLAQIALTQSSSLYN